MRTSLQERGISSPGPTDDAEKRMTIGYANTFHDPAIALAHEDKIFAEALAKHVPGDVVIPGLGVE